MARITLGSDPGGRWSSQLVAPLQTVFATARVVRFRPSHCRVGSVPFSVARGSDYLLICTIRPGGKVKLNWGQNKNVDLIYPPVMHQTKCFSLRAICLINQSFNAQNVRKYLKVTPPLPDSTLVPMPSLSPGSRASCHCQSKIEEHDS